MCKQGFDAAAGWDASTGLGTPDFGKILEAIDAIDARREARNFATSTTTATTTTTVAGGGAVEE
jgi:hypothetical protein